MPARLEDRRPPAQARRAHSRTASSDPGVDHDTATFIKRTLCPTRDHNEALQHLLPPLTSSNQVDQGLYAWVAVLLHQFVQTWYNRITPDNQFVSEVVHIIAHCTRGLESRLRKLDFESLLADEIPLLVHQHVQAVRIAKTSHEPQLIVHGLRPHVALTPAPLDPASSQMQAASEVAWCQLLNSRVLPLLLPPEDLANPCLNALVSEVMSQTIFYNAICCKVSEPWLLWDAIAKVVHLLDPAAKPDLGEESVQVLTLARILIWAFFDAVRHATIRLPRRRVVETLPQKRRPRDKSGPSQLCDVVERRPVVQMGIWACLSELLLLRRRMPWLTGALAFLQWGLLRGPGKLCDVDGPLDRLLCAAFHTRVLPAVANSLPTLLRSARLALFPNNSLAPGRPVPSAKEVHAIKQNAIDSITAIIPSRMRHLYFATRDVQSIRVDVEGALDLLDDQYMNKHLIVSLVDFLVVRLFPELSIADEA